MEGSIINQLFFQQKEDKISYVIQLFTYFENFLGKWKARIFSAAMMLIEVSGFFEQKEENGGRGKCFTCWERPTVFFLFFYFFILGVNDWCYSSNWGYWRRRSKCFTCWERSDSLGVNDHIKRRHCGDKKETRWSGGEGEERVIIWFWVFDENEGKNIEVDCWKLWWEWTKIRWIFSRPLKVRGRRKSQNMILSVWWKWPWTRIGWIIAWASMIWFWVFLKQKLGEWTQE